MSQPQGAYCSNALTLALRSFELGLALLAPLLGAFFELGDLGGQVGGRFLGGGGAGAARALLAEGHDNEGQQGGYGSHGF
jgi:hypothetical protein